MHGPLPVAGGATNGHGERLRRAALKDLRALREYFVIVPIMAAILFIGIYPKPVLDRIQPTTRRIVGCVRAATIRFRLRRRGRAGRPDLRAGSFGVPGMHGGALTMIVLAQAARPVPHADRSAAAPAGADPGRHGARAHAARRARGRPRTSVRSCCSAWPGSPARRRRRSRSGPGRGPAGARRHGRRRPLRRVLPPGHPGRGGARDPALLPLPGPSGRGRAASTTRCSCSRPPG